MIATLLTFTIRVILVFSSMKASSGFSGRLCFQKSSYINVSNFMSSSISDVTPKPGSPDGGNVWLANEDIEGFDASSIGKVASRYGIELLPSKEPYVSIEVAPSNSRRIFTGVDIFADMESIWDVLTAFDRLQDVVPSLVKNEVLSITPEGGARLAQVGGAKVLPGVTFTAKTVLDVRVFTESNPMPNSMLTNRVDKMPMLVRGVYPRPDSIISLPHRDIAIQNVEGEGDFEHYQGVWRMQSLPNCAPNGGNASRLTYAVEIKPKGFLPVKLIEARIATDLKANLAAIRDFVEAAAQRQQKEDAEKKEDDAFITAQAVESLQMALQAQALVELATLPAIQDLHLIVTEAVQHNAVVAHSADVSDAIETAGMKPDDASVLRGSVSQPTSVPAVVRALDRKQLAFENEGIQRVVVALEKDLKSALSKIQEIRALTRTTLDSGAAST